MISFSRQVQLRTLRFPLKTVTLFVCSCVLLVPIYLLLLAYTYKFQASQASTRCGATPKVRASLKLAKISCEQEWHLNVTPTFRATPTGVAIIGSGPIGQALSPEPMSNCGTPRGRHP